LSSSTIRGYLGNLNVMKLIQAAVPDVERYLKPDLCTPERAT
jgi:hypothetical protein